jgi:hypothetical protein
LQANWYIASITVLHNEGRNWGWGCAGKPRALEQRLKKEMPRAFPFLKTKWFLLLNFRDMFVNKYAAMVFF